MNYTVEHINGCTKKMVFNIESVDLTVQVQEALTNKQSTASLKGFRKGKAPLSVIQRLYGPQIELEALSRFIQNEFFKALDNEKWRTVGYPAFGNHDYHKEEKKVVFDVTVETFPNVGDISLSGLSFTKEKSEVTEKDIEDVKNNYLRSKQKLVSLESKTAALEKGHHAVINFEGEKENGERPDNMKANEHVLEIGSGNFIPGFEEGLVGMKVNDKKSIALTFPEDYHAPDLKGAKVTFHTELLEIKKQDVPDFTNEIAVEFGYESVEDFNKKTRTHLETQKERQANEKLHQQILEALVEKNKFDIPSILVSQQEEYVKEDLKRTLAQQGFNDTQAHDYFDKWHEDLHKKAEFQVRSGLILNNLAEKFKIETAEADLEEKYSEMANMSGMKIEEVKKFYSKESVKKNLLYALREEKTFKKIRENINIIL